MREVEEYYDRLDKLLENKDLKGLVELAKENGWNKNFSNKSYTIAMHKLIVGRKIGSKENQEKSYKWLEAMGYNPESFKFKLYASPKNPWHLF